MFPSDRRCEQRVSYLCIRVFIDRIGTILGCYRQESTLPERGTEIAAILCDKFQGGS